MVNDDYSTLKREMDKMKEGEIKHVRTGPGREGLVSIKKGKKLQSNLVNIEDMKPRAKVISSITPSQIY